MLPELAALEKILDLGAPHLEVQVVQQVSVASGPQIPIYAIGLGNPALDVPRPDGRSCEHHAPGSCH